MRAAAALLPFGRPSTRWRRAALIPLSLAAALACGLPARAAEPVVTVTLDRAEVMRLPAGTETIVVGNPIIADVTMLKGAGQLILTGKGFGETNLVFLDRQGDILTQALLRVRQSSSTLVVQRGVDRETYSCTPRCQPTVSLGDAPTYMKGAIENIDKRNAEASGAAASATPGAH